MGVWNFCIAILVWFKCSDIWSRLLGEHLVGTYIRCLLGDLALEFTIPMVSFALEVFGGYSKRGTDIKIGFGIIITDRLLIFPKYKSQVAVQFFSTIIPARGESVMINTDRGILVRPNICTCLPVNFDMQMAEN
jgi:hypothetical protein